LNPEDAHCNIFSENELREHPNLESVSRQCPSGMNSHELAFADPKLKELFAKWNRLPEQIKTAIETLIAASVR
jgi:hypothetical protein